jgi:hypothetical protein
MDQPRKQFVTEKKQSLFFGNREHKFFNDISNELITEVVKQSILYYPIEEKITKIHPLYGESKSKSYRNPVEIYARVLYNEPTFTNTQFGSDRKYTIDVYFQKTTMNETLGMTARPGDFIEWDNKFFEIMTVIEPQIIVGLPEFKFSIICNCESARLGVFNPKKSIGDINYDNKNDLYR